MAVLGVKERVYVDENHTDVLVFDPTKDFIMKVDGKKEIVMT